MARAQLILRPTEAKKLISKGLSQTEAVKRALSSGLLVIHPSSTTYFLMEYLTGSRPDGVWLAGMICPKGACLEGLFQAVLEGEDHEELRQPLNFPFSWVFRKGKLEHGLTLGNVLGEMGENDVYIKGVNAIDAHGHVGVLVGSLAGGTIGQAFNAHKKKGFQIIWTGGLEKFIPGAVREVAKEAGRAKTTDAMGIPCALFPVEAKPFTEIEALETLYGVEARPLAAGGVGGAEGSIMLVARGEDEVVAQVMQMLREEIKGAMLPDVILPDCETCHLPGCFFSGRKIDW